MQNFIESLFNAVFVLLGNNLTGACIIVAALITSRAITKLDRLSHKKVILNSLEAEILEYTRHSSGFVVEDLLLDFSQKLHQNKAYVTILPSELNNSIYKSLNQNLHVLPPDIAPSIVRFYNALHSVEGIINVINHPTFKDMAAAEKMEVYYHYINLKSTAQDMAIEALEKIRQAKN